MPERESSHLSVDSWHSGKLGLFASLSRRASSHRRGSSSSATSADQPISIAEALRQVSEAVAAAPSPASTSGLFTRAERRLGSLDSQTVASLPEQSSMMPSPTPICIKSTQGDQPTLGVGFCSLTLGTSGALCGVVETNNWLESGFPVATQEAANRDMQAFHELLDSISRRDWDSRTDEEKAQCHAPPSAMSVPTNVLDSNVPRGPPVGPLEKYDSVHEYERLTANFMAAKTAFEQWTAYSPSRSTADTLRVDLIDPGVTAYLYASHAMREEGRVVPLADMVTPECLKAQAPWTEGLSDFYYDNDHGKISW